MVRNSIREMRSMLQKYNKLKNVMHLPDALLTNCVAAAAL